MLAESHGYCWILYMHSVITISIKTQGYYEQPLEKYFYEKEKKTNTESYSIRII